MICNATDTGAPFLFVGSVPLWRCPYGWSTIR